MNTNKITALKNELSTTKFRYIVKNELDNIFELQDFKYTTIDDLQSGIIKYTNIFNDNNKQQLYIANYIWDKVLDYRNHTDYIFELYSTLINIKDKIPFNVYMILMFQIHSHKSYIKDSTIHQNINTLTQQLIQDLQQGDLTLLSYVINKITIDKSYRHLFVNQFIKLLFDNTECNIIQECFPELRPIYTWLFPYGHMQYNCNATHLRSIIIKKLYEYHLKYKNINKQNFILIRQYFTQELYKNRDFVDKCCDYELLTKDLIDIIFKHKNKHLINTLVNNHKQFDDYIKGLHLLQILAPVKKKKKRK